MPRCGSAPSPVVFVLQADSGERRIDTRTCWRSILVGESPKKTDRSQRPGLLIIPDQPNINHVSLGRPGAFEEFGNALRILLSDFRL